MRNLGVPPTVNQLDTQYTTDFLKTLAERHSYYSGTTNPTVSQIPNKQWIVFKNTTNGEVRLWTNDNGTLKNVLLNTNTNQPSFSVYQTSTQAIPSGVGTKVLFDTIEYDLGGYFNTALSRYTPLVAGHYQINTVVSVDQNQLVEILKNGSLYRRGLQLIGGASGNLALSASAIVPMNGTTDYLEINVFQSSGTSRNTSAASSPVLTYLNGCLIRPL